MRDLQFVFLQYQMQHREQVQTKQSHLLMLAAGAIPKPPTTCDDSSERISPNKFVVTITSKDCGCELNS